MLSKMFPFFSIDPRIAAVILLAIFIVFIYDAKPSLFFTHSGKLKSFGSGKNKTLCPLLFTVVIVAMFLYLACNFVL